MRFFRRFFLSLFSMVAVILAAVFPAAAIGTDPPVSPRFTGCLYIIGRTSQLGEVEVYLPLTYQTGYLSWDGSNLFNVTNSSVSGIMYSGSTEYNIRWYSWSAPEYRRSDTSYQYYDLTFTEVTSSNMVIAEDFPPRYDVPSLFPYIVMALLGVVILCLFIKRF